ncbi:MAG: hypothetical protein AABY75_03410, partial [Bacteroidota bacterium]
ETRRRMAPVVPTATAVSPPKDTTAFNDVVGPDDLDAHECPPSVDCAIAPFVPATHPLEVSLNAIAFNC